MSWEERFAERVPSESLREDLWQLWRMKYRGVHPGEDFKLSAAQWKRARQDAAWRRWIERMLSLEVEMKPNGRATVRDPDDPEKRVEVQWEYRKRRGHVPLSVHVYAEVTPPGLDICETCGQMRRQHPRKACRTGFKRWAGPRPFLAWNQAGDLDLYLAACQIRFDQDRDKRKRLPTSRPRPGEPADTSFYAAILDTHDRYVSEGERAPVKRIADDMDTNLSTVKSWLRRGRNYLEKGT